MQPRELADYATARAKDVAFDAVHTLWRRRREAGLKQVELARVIGRDPGWISKNLRGPGNWTLRTLGELVEGLDGELEIVVHASEDAPSAQQNYNAYDSYKVPVSASQTHASSGIENSSQSIGKPQTTNFTNSQAN